MAKNSNVIQFPQVKRKPIKSEKDCTLDVSTCAKNLLAEIDQQKERNMRVLGLLKKFN